MASHVGPRVGVASFLAIAFGLAWLPFLPATFGGEPFGAVLVPLAPALAAVAVRRWITREGFADSGLRLNLRRHWRLYLPAAAWPVLATPLAVAVALVLDVAPDGGGLPWGIAGPSPTSVFGWLLGSVLLAPVLLGEELGWRGYLQVRLFPHRPLLAAAATGTIWGLWHFPLILSGGEPTADRVQTLLLFPLFAVMLSVFLGWLRQSTGSIWPGSVAHAANNIAQLNLTRLAFTGSSAGTLPASASWPILVGEAIVLLGMVAVVSHKGSVLRGDAARSRRPKALPARAPG